MPADETAEVADDPPALLDGAAETVDGVYVLDGIDDVTEAPVTEGMLNVGAVTNPMSGNPKFTLL
jgi:hypothetical protein